MTRIRIKYLGSDGAVTTRVVSDWVPHIGEAIEAFCHLRGERRTFKLMGVLDAVDEDSGEVLPNPWLAFGLDKSSAGRTRLQAFFGDQVAALRVLLIYTKGTRGFAARERGRVVDYLLRRAGPEWPGRDEVEAWLGTLWAGDSYAYRCGDEREFQVLLDAVRPEQLPALRAAAIQIALGSGRRPVPPEVAERLMRHFGSPAGPADGLPPEART